MIGAVHHEFSSSSCPDSYILVKLSQLVERLVSVFEATAVLNFIQSFDYQPVLLGVEEKVQDSQVRYFALEMRSRFLDLLLKLIEVLVSGIKDSSSDTS
jgi:hypothetical protein